MKQTSHERPPGVGCGEEGRCTGEARLSEGHLLCPDRTRDFPTSPAETPAKDMGRLPRPELTGPSPACTRRAPQLLTLLALHRRVIADFLEADVPQVEDARHDLQHQRLLLCEDPDHVHRVLGEEREIIR